MTLVNIDLRNAGYETGPDDRVVFYSPANRNEQGTIISTAEKTVELVDGQSTVELAPGPVVVRILAQGVADTREKSGYVPDEGPVSLWDVVLDWTPALVDQGVLAILVAVDEALGQVAGAVDSAIGTRLDGKSDKGHQHNSPDIADATFYAGQFDNRFAGKVVKLNTDGKLYIHPSSITAPTDPANKGYVDTKVGDATQYISFTDDRFANKLVKLGSNGKLSINTSSITDLTDPVNKQYVDSKVGNSAGGRLLWWN